MAAGNDPRKRSTPAPFEVPKTSKTSAQIEDMLIAARVKMLLEAPFFGNLACRLIFKDATDWCPTAATDGKYFYYNRDFIDALDSGNRVFLMAHEVLHNVYDHMGTCGSRDPRLWNISNDYVINYDLVENRIGTKITLVDICYDPRFAQHTSEEVYDILFKEAEEDGRVINVSTLDVHLDPSAGEGMPQDGEGEGDGNGPEVLSREEIERVKEDFRNAVIQSAKAAGASNVPGGVKRILKDILEPELNWRELLAQQIQTVIKSDYTMMNPSRKGQDSGIYLPGMDRETTIDIAAAIDMSGSIMDDMARDFISEVKGIMEQYTDFRIHLFCFDTSVHNPQVFNQYNIDEFDEYDLQGGGGTDFDCVFDYLKEAGIQPNKLVMFTDGYPFGSWGDANYCDTLFIVHGGGYGNHTPEAPFGVTVKYERKH